MEYMEPTPAAPLTTTCSSQSLFPNSLNSPQPPVAAAVTSPCAACKILRRRQVDELQAELAKTQAEVVNMQLQQANVGALLCMEMGLSSPQPNSQQSQSVFETSHGHPSFIEDDHNNNLGSLWEPL
ncbi:hypothetical protein V6N12_014575 [Hibiscus sabdariffa]|uniref:LOB domain-containing protein n=1 Tax=Hibiscus sabdariffa TaxID=183260 RepID=A0ABR2DKK3_9ROSI